MVSDISHLIQVYKVTFITTLMFAGLFYGLFIILAGTALTILREQNPRQRLWRDPASFTLAVMLAISTSTLAILLTHSLGKFALETSAAGVLVWEDAALVSLSLAQEQITDFVLLYRVYVVYQSWRAAAPGGIIWLGSLACSIALLYLNATLIGDFFVFTGANSQWTLACGVLSVTQNVLSSGMLIYRILSVTRRSKESLRRFRPALALVAESGSVYMLWWLIGLVIFACRSPGFLFITFNFPHVAGCVTAGLILQVELRRRAESKYEISQSKMSTIQFVRAPLQTNFAAEEATSFREPNLFSVDRILKDEVEV